MRNLDQLDLDILAHLFCGCGHDQQGSGSWSGWRRPPVWERVRKLQQDWAARRAPTARWDYSGPWARHPGHGLPSWAPQPPDHRCRSRCHPWRCPEVISLYPHGRQG